ncbi:uncharacterized protein LOC130621317 [Hydractinia symbiolongicarpus]|uniref:uncharacterized protein LOC130621317 n=1 Tax=Hydractinia symbiolongicarpus TaxID=13093 RepID=UPI00254D2F4B|nr:uncharacterized protein LOC130621317 [Hydractinia symbiolongicarpus]
MHFKIVVGSKNNTTTRPYQHDQQQDHLKQLYSKPTNSHLHLHATSCHNESSIKGIPKGVALRLRRICSSDGNYQKKAKKYTSYLKQRGHKSKCVDHSFLNNQPQFTILQQQPELNKRFPKGSILVANKRERNLRDLLLRSDPYNMKPDLTTNTSSGYIKCNKNCDSYKNYVDETSCITSFATRNTFKIRRSSTCTTSNVVYVAFCKNCGKQGVGSTIPWKSRLANYKSHIKKKVPSCRIVNSGRNKIITQL